MPVTGGQHVPGYPAKTVYDGANKAVSFPIYPPNAPAPTVAAVGVAGTTKYEYAVITQSASGDSAPSLVVTVLTGFAALDATHHNDLSWGNVVGNTGYKILRRVAGAPNGLFQQYAVVGANVVVYSDIGAGVNSTYVPNVKTQTVSPLGTFSVSAHGTNVDLYYTQVTALPSDVVWDLFNQLGKVVGA